MSLINPIKQVIENARQSGLLQQFDVRALAPQCESIFVPFSVFGVPGDGVDYYFPSNPNLDYDRSTIVAMEVIDTTTNSNFPYPSNVDGLAATQLSQLLFVASNNNREQIFSVPLSIMSRRLNTGKILQMHLNEQIWQNCYIQSVDSTGLSSTGGIWLNVYYIRNDQ
jgi:hypothetical protein